MAADNDDPIVRIADLERELHQRDDKIKELRAELDEGHLLVGQMREQTEDVDRLIESWIEVFSMERDDDGEWLFDSSQSELWQRHADLWGSHQKLLRQWNKFVGEYNVTIRRREMGRPVAASAAQQEDVLKRCQLGDSLRVIARATGLGLSTVRTILAARPRNPTNALRRREMDRLRAAAYRARKKARDALPKQITEVKANGAALIKAAKGLGR